MIGFLRRDGVREAADSACRRVVEQARQAVFFAEYGVPDTFAGRFELACLFAFLYLRRLKAEREDSKRLSQAFCDRMFAEFDRVLRELGIGDLRVGKEIKRMAEAFYGRIRAYEEGLGGGDEVLAAALARNLFGTLREPPCAAAAFARYVRRAAGDLAGEDRAELLSGRVRFRVPERCGRGEDSL